jgi:hypothetical protein
MSKTIRVCGNKIEVKVRTGEGWLATTKTIKTICGRPPNHTQGNCAPGPTHDDLLKQSSWL